MTNSALKDILTNSFLYDNCTDLSSLEDKIKGKPMTFYLGIDLTGQGLHVGHLANLMLARKLLNEGQKIIIILGGATTYIGDPSGKEKSRQMLSPEQIQSNKKNIAKDVISILSPENKDSHEINQDEELVWSNDSSTIRIVDNFYWLFKKGYITFLRDIGQHFTINQMITSDTVKRRLKNQQPFSFLEFNYPILQAYDFYYLNDKYDCDIQIGGGDQWLNIIQGVNLIKKINPTKKVFGFTVQLITRSDGKKMGKTENGAIWINEQMLSNKEYFQYFRNLPDADTERFLNIFTSKSKEEIKDIISLEPNKAKEILAFEATKECRGQEAADAALKEIKALFAGEIVDAKEVSAGTPIVELIVQSGFAPSKSEARRIIQSGGVKINNEKISDIKTCTSSSVNEFILSCGKSKKQAFKVK